MSGFINYSQNQIIMHGMGANKLSELQLELLKIYSFNPSKEELTEIKGILARFFADKLTNNVGKAIQDKNITDEDLEFPPIKKLTSQEFEDKFKDDLLN